MRDANNAGKIWSIIRDCDGTFGFDPSEQDLVCCSIKSLRDLVDGFVHGTAWLVRDWTIMIRPT